MATDRNREIRLAARPHGEPVPGDFELVETDIPTPGPGQVLVRNTWMSVDPYMRGRMNDTKSYMPPFQLGEPLDGGAVGEVVASDTPEVPVGATVTHRLGWRDYALLPTSDARVIDTDAAPAQAYLSALGGTGLTAYVTLTSISPVREGDVVFVSGAAGAVGSVAGQIARKLGASLVIGSAGGPAKRAKLLDTFGYDVALDYKAGPIGPQLTEAAPNGIDVYLDNVGGDHLEAALNSMNVGGRIGLVGAISTYNEVTAPPGPRNLIQAVGKEITLRGMLVSYHLDRFPEYLEKAAAWLADGSLRTEETVVDGLEQAPSAFIGMLNGGNTGKMLVRLT